MIPTGSYQRKKKKHNSLRLERNYSGRDLKSHDEFRLSIGAVPWKNWDRNPIQFTRIKAFEGLKNLK